MFYQTESRIYNLESAMIVIFEDIINIYCSNYDAMIPCSSTDEAKLKFLRIEKYLVTKGWIRIENVLIPPDINCVSLEGSELRITVGKHNKVIEFKGVDSAKRVFEQLIGKLKVVV